MQPSAKLQDSQTSPKITLLYTIEQMWKHKVMVLIVWFASAVGAVLYAISLPNIYKSEAVMIAAIDSGGLGLSGQLGSLASLAGISIGKDKQGDKSELAVQLLKSREFVTNFLLKHETAVDLMAVKKWHQDTDTLEYDPDIYDVKNKKWTRDVDLPRHPEPSPQELYKQFKDSFSAEKDKLTGLIKVSLQHPSPKIAERWLTQIIADVNEEVRQRDIAEANRSLQYLQDKVQQANTTELKSLFYSLIEDQTKTLLLANVKAEYALRMVDAPFAPEEKSEPRRALLVLLLCFAGFLLSILLALFASQMQSVRQIFRRKV